MNSEEETELAHRVEDRLAQILARDGAILPEAMVEIMQMIPAEVLRGHDPERTKILIVGVDLRDTASLLEAIRNDKRILYPLMEVGADQTIQKIHELAKAQGMETTHASILEALSPPVRRQEFVVRPAPLPPMPDKVDDSFYERSSNQPFYRQFERGHRKRHWLR